jgi:hypothetical protein
VAVRLHVLSDLHLNGGQAAPAGVDADAVGRDGGGAGLAV